MRVVFFILLSTIFSLIGLNAQTIQWQNTIGGNQAEWLEIIELCSDGNYIVGGYSCSNISGDVTENSRGTCDYWLIKVGDISGDIIWQKRMGGNDFENLTSIKETSDGGYILGGYSRSTIISGEKSELSRGADDYWIIKLDANRNIIWDKTFGGSGVDRLRSIIETPDGGFIMGGISNSNISGDKTDNSHGNNDMWIIKIDGNGNIEWQKTIGGSNIDWVQSIINAVDGGYILAGSSHSNVSGDKTENSRGLGDYWIIKIDVLGNIIWQRTIGGDNGDYVKFSLVTSDGNYIIGGDSSSNISGEKSENTFCNSNDVWIIKLDLNGQILWQKTVGGSSTEWLGSVRETLDNGFILGVMSSSGISGFKTEPSRGDRDYWVVKLDEFGNVEWDKTLGGDGMDQFQSIVQANDGDYVFGGWSFSNISNDKTENSNGLSDYWIVKLQMDSTDFSSSSNNIFFCDGNDLELFAIGGGLAYLWSGPNGFSSTEQNPIITNASSLNAGVYNVVITDATFCSESKVTVTTMEGGLFNAGSDGTLSICTNETSVDLFDSLDGNPDIGGSWSPSLVSGSGIFDPSIDVAGIYTYTANNATCGSVSANVQVSVLTTFPVTNFSINIGELSENNFIEITINSQANYEYSLDNINYQTSNIFDNLIGGNYTVYAREINGCGLLNENIYIIDYPRFFSPNNDGANDTWGLRGNINQNYTIIIFNRFGKVLKQLNLNNSEWNGFYNGKPQPSSDYWFKIIFNDGRIKTGHFALIR